jgi:uncharacterized membrane-anchored protein
MRVGILSLVTLLLFSFVLARPVAAAVSSADAQLEKLPWRAGTQALSESHGKFRVPDHAVMVQGADARKADSLLNGQANSDSEAVVSMDDGSVLYLIYNDSGYVSIDDWNDVNADDMLKSISEADATANEDRTKAGLPTIHTDGWIEPPTLNRQQNTVVWILKLHDGRGATFSNAVALALGRHGYERFVLATKTQDPNALRAKMASLVPDYTFQPGFRFTDYVQGDRMAELGVAALVGTAAGATIAKTVGFTAILLFLKKFFLLGFAAIAGIFVWLRKKLTSAFPK